MDVEFGFTCMNLLFGEGGNVKKLTCQLLVVLHFSVIAIFFILIVSITIMIFK